MSASIATFASEVREELAQLCWRQWQSLMGYGTWSDAGAAAAMDPEALLLMSLAVRAHERRLDDLMLWWAEDGAQLLCVQRLQTMLAEFPAPLAHDVAWFAQLSQKGGDRRWRPLLKVAPTEGTPRPGKGPRQLHLLEAPTLLLRLRAGLGVGAKADVLSFLLATASARSEHQARTTAEVMAKALCYSVASVRRAAGEMALARLIAADSERPVQYHADARAWAHVLQPAAAGAVRDGGFAAAPATADLPPWRFWAQMFALTAAVLALCDDAKFQKAAAVVQASRCRDIAERFRRVLEWNRIPWPDPRRTPGERYLPVFLQLMRDVVAWMQAKV